MNRKWVFLLLAALVGLLAILLILRPAAVDPNAPRFVAAQTQPVGPFGTEFYDWGGAVPFADDKVWIHTVLNRNNRHNFLYDLDQGKVVGELFNGWEIFGSRDQTKVLFQGASSPDGTVLDRLKTLANRMWSGGKPLFRTNSLEGFWAGGLRDNSARRIGEMSQLPGTSSRWIPSPDFRRGYSQPTAEKKTVLCDLESDAFQRIRLPGEPVGWWDAQSIMVRSPTNAFLLFDVVTQNTAILFSGESITNTLGQLGISGGTRGLDVFTEWNGREYNFYFYARGQNRDAGESFLLKADRRDPALKLFARDFKFGYLGRLDGDATHYVYEGQPEGSVSGRGGNGAVIVRDLKDNSERTLVPPDNSGQYSLARFYSHSVIYSHRPALWRVDLNGSNNVPLLPGSGN